MNDFFFHLSALKPKLIIIIKTDMSIKKIILPLSFVFAFLFTHSAYSQFTEGFNVASICNPCGNFSFTQGGVQYNVTVTGTSAKMKDEGFTDILVFDAVGSSTVSIVRNDGNDFLFSGILVRNALDGAAAVNIGGYKSGALQGSAQTVNAGVSEVTLNFNETVDEVRFTTTNSNEYAFDSFSGNNTPPVSNTAPTVTTTAASSVTTTSATLAGNATADGGASITERGIVYAVTATNNDPLISGAGVTKDTNGTGTGVFSESITGLASGTQYSFKAYATNSEGTSYGAVQTFTTSTVPSGGTTLTEGDIAFTRINIDDESFSFVLLVPITNTTKFVITDEAWDGSTLLAFESSIQFTATSAFLAGEEISISSASLSFSSSGSGTATLTSVGVNNPTGGNMLGAAGDNLFIYQSAGTPGSNDFITGINANGGVIGSPGNAWSTATSSSNSLLPSGLTNGTNALGIFPNGGAQTEVDNARYKATALRTGDKATVLAAIMNLSNWEYDNDVVQAAVGTSFTITSANVAPTVTSVSSSTDNGTYKVGDAVAVTVTFSESVTVTGTPQLTLETGTVDRAINYTSGTGTSTLTFSYTVQAGDSNSDLDYVATNSLGLNGGTIKDAGGKDANLTLASPGAANSLGANKALVIDGVVPTVTSVNSSTNNGTYKVGDAIAVTVTFSESVTVTGTPQITLETGTTDRAADYTSGSGSNTLTFNYTVQSGDVSADLDYVSTNSLALNGGTIKDGAGNNATLTLATPGAANSLGANKALVIDGVVPTVTSVSSTTANGSYKTGDAIAVTVTFSEAVTVTGTPQITLETGATDRTVNYASGSGSNTLTFNYTVQSGDASTDLDYVATNSLILNSGTIRDAAGNNATLTLAVPGAANSLGANKALVIDGVGPTVTSVSSTTANGSYKTGDAIAVTVTFSEAVTVTGTPQITLETGATDRTVNYASGSGSNTLTFNYTVQSGDVSTDLDYVATNSLILNSGTIRDAAGNNATLTLVTPGAANSLGANKAIVIDGVAPTITSLGLHNSNSFLEIFTTEGLYNTNGGSEALEISDIAISISGGTATNPIITSLKQNDGTSDLVGGESLIRVNFTTTGVADGSEIVKIDFADGSSVFDATGNAAIATQSNNTRTLNDLIKPNITGVTLAADNSYIDVTFNEGVYEDNCGGGGLQASDFSLSINNGTATTPVISSVKQNDNTVEGSATALTGGETVVRIFFSVTGTPDGAETLEVDLQTNAVFDQNGLIADANQTANNTASLNDETTPTVLEVTSNATNGTFKAGDNINVYVQYSEEVLVTGTPQLELETGTTDRTISYVDRSVSTLRFVYTVQAGDASADLDVTSSTALSLNGGTIKDAAGNNASLTVQQGATVGSLASNKAIVIDGVVPTVTSVSSTTNNGTYKAGDAVAVTVGFTEAVTVTGTPQLTLETGSTDRTANYSSGSGSNTLIFNYTVQLGDVNADLDYVATNSLTLNSGTVKDASGNDATLTLATPGAANSLGANKALVIDALVPTVTSVSVPNNGSNPVNSLLTFTVNTSENVFVNTTSGHPSGSNHYRVKYTSSSFSQ